MPDTDLLRQSLRTMGILVGACVLFVGTLSTVAVVVTSKAVGGTSASAGEVAPQEAATKKPLSI